MEQLFHLQIKSQKRIIPVKIVLYRKNFTAIDRYEISKKAKIILIADRIFWKNIAFFK